jgi:branched-chain amino acid transport system permease protein
VPSGGQALRAGVGFIVVAAIIAPLFDATNSQRMGVALAYAMTMLSLVLLTGYGGYVSLAQLTFVGLGAATAAKLNSGSPLAVLLAVLVAAAVGALVALPVLRLTGLYLALATFAFGQLMDKLVFQSSFMFGYNGSLNAKRMSLLGYHFDNTHMYVIFMAVVFAFLGMAVLALRRGPIGRLLIAMRDSPAAVGTLGLNQRWFRVALFSLSAGIAGLAGALLAGLRGTISAPDFQTLASLPLLLLAVVAGVTSVSGAFLGGTLLMLLPVLQSTFPSLSGLVFLVIGFGAIMLGRDPNGLANLFFNGMRALATRLPLPERWQGGAGTTADAGPVRGRSGEPELAAEADYVSEGQVAQHGLA